MAELTRTLQWTVLFWQPYNLQSKRYFRNHTLLTNECFFHLLSLLFFTFALACPDPHPPVFLITLGNEPSLGAIYTNEHATNIITVYAYKGTSVAND